jgi:hypothetical protein
MLAIPPGIRTELHPKAKHEGQPLHKNGLFVQGVAEKRDIIKTPIIHLKTAVTKL